MNIEVLKLAIQYAIEHRSVNGSSTCELGILQDTIMIQPLHFANPDWEFVCKITPSMISLGLSAGQWDIITKKLSTVLKDIKS